MRVACCQISPQVESPDRSTQLALDAISAAVAGGAELIVLPELANSGYVFDRAEETRTAAVPPGADLIRDWGARPQRVTRSSSPASASSPPTGACSTARC